MKKNKRNYWIYLAMICLFGALIYGALSLGENFATSGTSTLTETLHQNAFDTFKNIITQNLQHPLSILLFQIIVILIAVRLFSYLFRKIGQPGVIGEIVAGIVLGPSLLGLFFPDVFNTLFPTDSLTNLNLLSQIGLILFMFVIGMEVDFSVLKNKMNETLVISHAGIVVPFFLGTVISFWVYEEYAADKTDFLPFALFIGISMSITAFPVLARIIQERNLTKTPIGILSIASAANDDVTAWCLLAIVIAVAKAGTFVSALYTVGLTLLFIAVMFLVIRPFLKKIGELYANSEVINKSFVGFIFLILVISSTATEIIGIHALFGAFIAGVIMPVNLGFRKVMMEKVEDISLIFFLPLFFAFTGLRTEIGLINTPELWGICLIFITIAILGKLGGCGIAARLVGESWKDSLIIGTLMNTRGLMELVALNIGYEMGVLPPEIFVILVIMALITTFMTTPLLNLVEKIFASVEKIEHHTTKILFSFGKPESGAQLLTLSAYLSGNKSKKDSIIAAHYTLGTDLNPVKAKQYSRESFAPLVKEAKRLGVQVEQRYKVTNKVTNEIIKLADDEQIKLLLVGAGPAFIKENFNAPILDTAPRPVLRKLFNEIQDRTLHLPGNLLKEKLKAILNNVSCPVGIFVNREFTEIERLFLLISEDEDVSLLTCTAQLFEHSDITVRVCLYKDASPSLSDAVAAILSQHPQRFVMDTVAEENRAIGESAGVVIINYDTCTEHYRKHTQLAELPSLLVIRKGKSDE